MMTPSKLRGRIQAVLLSLAIAGAALSGAVPAMQAQDDARDCSGCHDQGQKVKDSAHAALECARCHEKHEVFPHPDNVPKPVCGTCHERIVNQHAASVHGQEIKKGNAGAPDCAVCHGATHEIARASTAAFKKSVPETCGMCHAEVSAQYNASVHGKAVARGVPEAPVCTDCHGEHNILRPKQQDSLVNVRQIRDTCGRCHNDVKLTEKFGMSADRLTSFDASFHGLALRAGSQSVANCASCHGVHNILPSTDRNSTIHPTNLAKTCGNCHPGAGSKFAIGAVHIIERGAEPAPVRYTRLFYVTVIPVTIGLMLLHHAGDWVRKLIRLRLKAVPAAVVIVRPVVGELRMLPWEIIQHAVLALSFIVLAWSGFALKYPGEWWARPLVFTEATWPIRGLVHRVAAVLLIAVTVTHVFTLLLNSRLRRHWYELFPTKSDIHEGFGVLAYNLGLRKTKPKVSPHSYVEKVEYWAMVWGTIVMAFTGLLLWFNNFTLTWLPKEWLDVATSVHFYEAVLATLAILVWHLYTVIFDPDVYPMDPAWLTGRSVRKRESHAHRQQQAEAGDTPRSSEAGD